MMGKAEERDHSKRNPAEFRRNPAFPAATIREYGAFEEYYAYTEMLYNEVQADFLATDPRDPGILRKEKDCEKAAR